VRICDNGGWTDTWFGGPGRVVNIAVTPGVHVSIRATTGPDPVVLDVESFDDRYPIVPGASRIARASASGGRARRVAAAGRCRAGGPRAFGRPRRCGAGTSASVAVALLGALAAARSEQLSPRDVAYAAHRLEVDILGVESGIQISLSAAFGGINYIDVEPSRRLRCTDYLPGHSSAPGSRSSSSVARTSPRAFTGR